MATSAPSSARLTVSSCLFDRGARRGFSRGYAFRVRASSIGASAPPNPLSAFFLECARPASIIEELWKKTLAPDAQNGDRRKNAGGDLPGSRKIVDGSIGGGGVCFLWIKGTRTLQRPFDYLRVPNMTFPKRERRRRYFSKKLVEKESDKGWHPELCTYESEFAKQHALYWYNLLAFPWEKGAFERFVDKLERKYFPDEHIDALVPPLDKKPERKSRKQKKPSSLHESASSTNFSVASSSSVADSASDTEPDVEETSPSPRRSSSSSSIEIEISPDDWEPETNPPDSYAEAVREEESPKIDASTTPRPPVITRSMKLPEDWDGPLGTVVLIDKPHGWTSFSVCAKLRKLLKIKKVGHAGTLDPMATGLLIVCVGKATKFTDSYQAMKKVYSGTLRLGEATPSYDADTIVSERLPWEHVRDEDVQIAKEEFVGTIRQVPPLYSALKVEGERLYEKARRGETFQMPPRLISIDELHIERNPLDRQNLDFKVSCSKGTYVRSLAYDLGRALNTCAHLVSLRRDKIGEYSVEDSWRFSDLGSNFADDFLGRVCSKTPSAAAMNLSLEDAWEFPDLQRNPADDDDDDL